MAKNFLKNKHFCKISNAYNGIFNGKRKNEKFLAKRNIFFFYLRIQDFILKYPFDLVFTNSAMFITNQKLLALAVSRFSGECL